MDTERAPADAQNGVVLDADMFEGLKVRCFLIFVVVVVVVCVCICTYVKKQSVMGFFCFFVRRCFVFNEIICFMCHRAWEWEKS